MNHIYLSLSTIWSTTAGLGPDAGGLVVPVATATRILPIIVVRTNALVRLPHNTDRQERRLPVRRPASPGQAFVVPASVLASVVPASVLASVVPARVLAKVEFDPGDVSIGSAAR